MKKPLLNVQFHVYGTGVSDIIHVPMNGKLFYLIDVFESTVGANYSPWGNLEIPGTLST